MNEKMWAFGQINFLIKLFYFIFHKRFKIKILEENLAKIKMSDTAGTDESLFPIAVLIDELRHEDVQVNWHYNFLK